MESCDDSLPIQRKSKQHLLSLVGKKEIQIRIEDRIENDEKLFSTYLTPVKQFEFLKKKSTYLQNYILNQRPASERPKFTFWSRRNRKRARREKRIEYRRPVTFRPKPAESFNVKKAAPLEKIVKKSSPPLPNFDKICTTSKITDTTVLPIYTLQNKSFKIPKKINTETENKLVETSSVTPIVEPKVSFPKQSYPTPEPRKVFNVNDKQKKRREKCRFERIARMSDSEGGEDSDDELEQPEHSKPVDNDSPPFSINNHRHSSSKPHVPIVFYGGNDDDDLEPVNGEHNTSFSSSSSKSEDSFTESKLDTNISSSDEMSLEGLAKGEKESTNGKTMEEKNNGVEYCPATDNNDRLIEVDSDDEDVLNICIDDDFAL